MQIKDKREDAVAREVIQMRSETGEERRKGKRVKARDEKMRCCKYQRIQMD